MIFPTLRESWYQVFKFHSYSLLSSEKTILPRGRVSLPQTGGPPLGFGLARPFLYRCELTRRPANAQSLIRSRYFTGYMIQSEVWPL